MRLKFFSARSSASAGAEDENSYPPGTVNDGSTKQYNFAGHLLETMVSSTFGRAATEPRHQHRVVSSNQRARAHTLADVMQLFDENGQTANESFRIKANGAIVRNRPTILAAESDAILPASEISSILSSAITTVEDKQDVNQGVQMHQESSGGSNSRSVIHTDYYDEDQRSIYSDTSLSSHGQEGSGYEEEEVRYLSQGVVSRGKEPDHPTPLRPPPRSVNSNLNAGQRGHRSRENSNNTDVCEALVIQNDRESSYDWESMYHTLLQENLYLRQQIQTEREQCLAERQASAKELAASQLEIRHLQRALSLIRRLAANNSGSKQGYARRRRSMGDLDPLLDYTEQVDEDLCRSKSSVPLQQKLKILLDEIKAFQAQEDILITKQFWLQQQKSQLEKTLKDKDQLISQLQQDLAMISSC